MCPKNAKEVFRQKIELKKYDFSTAIVKLVGSINGRFTGKQLDKYGLNRVKKLCSNGRDLEKSVIF